jgi:2-amino-4-hydroxy-6-hydroxymethyldihydropteridine diphosphokinase
VPKYIVAAGSSHPMGKSYILEARDMISRISSMVICGESPIFKNGSIGMPLNRLCFNCAWAIFAPLEPRVFYRELKVIEHRLGRIRSYKNAPRTIDLDVLMSFDLVYNSGTFSVPHKEFYRREFFMRCAFKAIISAQWPLPYVPKKTSIRNYLVPCS